MGSILARCIGTGLGVVWNFCTYPILSGWVVSEKACTTLGREIAVFVLTRRTNIRNETSTSTIGRTSGHTLIHSIFGESTDAGRAIGLDVLDGIGASGTNTWDLTITITVMGTMGIRSVSTDSHEHDESENHNSFEH